MKVERSGPVLARRNYSLEAEPPSGRITLLGKLDSFASEGLGLAVKQDLGPKIRDGLLDDAVVRG